MMKKLSEELKKEVTEKIDALKSLKDSNDIDQLNGGIKEFEDVLMKIGSEIYKTDPNAAAGGMPGGIDPNNIDPEVLKQMMEQMQKQNGSEPVEPGHAEASFTDNN